ncbi:MAG: hypothetical protein HY506_02300 [Candidatus Yanofskybacteria bacterium]|nr:hypothetical protein [Candidatus Yanofskybacteria bacterium]
MRFKNFAVLPLLMFVIVSCAPAKNTGSYDLVFKILKDGEIFIHGSVIIESEQGEFKSKAINESGTANFRVEVTETKFWVGVTSGENFYYFDLVDVSSLKIQNGMRMVVMDIGMFVPKPVPDMQKKPEKKIWT